MTLDVQLDSSGRFWWVFFCCVCVSGGTASFGADSLFFHEIGFCDTRWPLGLPLVFTGVQKVLVLVEVYTRGKPCG